MLHNILMEANKPTTVPVVDPVVSVSGTVPTYLNDVTYTPELISSSDTENRYSLGGYTLICTTSTMSIE